MATANPKKETFAQLLEEAFSNDALQEGRVVKGRVQAIDGGFAIIDVGLKSEGRVPLSEFADHPGAVPELNVGDEIDVFLDRLEGRLGEVMLSREKARREASWLELEQKFSDGAQVEGVIFGRVKGGFTVDIGGAIAFLPGSQVDVRPIKDISPLMGIKQPFQILKMDRVRGNIVVSRRSILEESRAEQRSEIVSTMQEGQVLEGTVKNLTDYGAFVDLGGVDGLLHVTDISWKRVNHPSDVLHVGQVLKVQITKFNKETQRISLGMKQLEQDPWEGAIEKYKIGTKHMGTVSNVTDYGAFIELETGIEGLVHVTEMSWTKKNIHPSKILSNSQKVEVMVLDIEPSKRRISLGIKQCFDNPWNAYVDSHPVGTIIEGEIRNITDFGLFIALTPDMDGMLHINDLSFDMPGDEAIKAYKKGDMVKAKILDVDIEKERISLGIKQLNDKFSADSEQFKKGQTVTCTVTKILDSGLEVTIGEGSGGFIKRGDLSRDRLSQRTDRFAVGERVDAKVLGAEKGSRKFSLSIKALELEEEKQVLSEYGSADSGATLGDILGAALKKATPKAAAEKAPAKKAAAPKKAETEAEVAPKKASKPKKKAENTEE